MFKLLDFSLGSCLSIQWLKPRSYRLVGLKTKACKKMNEGIFSGDQQSSSTGIGDVEIPWLESKHIVTFFLFCLT